MSNTMEKTSAVLYFDGESKQWTVKLGPWYPPRFFDSWGEAHEYLVHKTTQGEHHEH